MRARVGGLRRRARRHSPGFAAFRARLGPLLLGSCLVFGLFYLLGRQAFCNYYYLLDATALFAAASLTAPRASPASPR